nr:hypothetical protein [Actinocrispum wychmicini]
MTIASAQHPPGWRIGQIYDGPLERADVVAQMPEDVTVTRLAQQATDFPGGVVVIHGQAFASAGCSLADGTPTALQGVQRRVLLGGNAVGGLDVPSVRGLSAGRQYLAVVCGAPRPRVRCRTARTRRAVFTLSSYSFPPFG